MHVPRTTTTGAPGGGVALIYFLDILNIKHGTAAFQASSFELMGASFSCHHQTINIYIVYCPGHPGTDRAFMEEFGSFLDDLLLVGGNSVICGDFNYWVDDPSSKPFSAEFVELLENFVSFPTHLSDHTHYLILVPAGSDYVKHVEALPIDSDMSDHALILFSLEVMRPHAVRKTITFRSYRNVDNNTIVNDIEHILNVLDVSSLTVEDCTIWYNNFLNSLENKFCPLISKEILVKADAPWYDRTVAVLRRQCRRAERGWRQLRSDYTAARRAVGNQVLLQKVEFYRCQVAFCKGDQKKLCCLMNNLMGRGSPTSLPSSESDTQLALDFSRFFQSKVLRIREELDGTPVHGDYSVEFHPQQSVRSLFLKFNPVDELSIRRYIRKLNKTYCSLDPINVKITVAFEAAAPFIASLVNKYFEECIFVTSEKVALLRPMLKKPGLDVEDMNSFRPVSNLSFLSKIVERAMLDQLLPFLEENRIIPKNQSAYRQFLSAEAALCKIHNDLVTNACSGKASLLVLLDLSAAFDTGS